MGRSRWGSISVGRRIALLVVVEALIMTILVVHVSRSLATLAADLDYSRRFILAPTETLPDALERMSAIEVAVEDHAPMPDPALLASLREALRTNEALISRYRAEWVAADSASADALRFRDELAEVGQLALLDDERRALDMIARSDARLEEDAAASLGSDESWAQMFQDVREMKRGLRLLLATNVRYVGVDHQVHEERARRTRVSLVSLGIAGVIATILLGLYIRNAIGPRITAMVAKVRTFRETGEYVRTPDLGIDEIAVLSNALDSGFSAIRERDRDRERFLAVAAHELKTPLTSITGFVDAALGSHDRELRQRALEVVSRQSNRLNRLVQDLLLAASARQGSLAFHPQPLEVRAVVERVLAELESAGHRFSLTGGERAFILGDEELLQHTLWQLLSYAAAVTEKNGRVAVSITRRDAVLRVDVVMPKLTVSRHELERAFAPFASVQYEGGGLRYAVGLYLAREIAALHGGSLAVREDRRDSDKDETTFRLELPA